MTLFKLYLDPGHGGSDSGAVGNGLKEKDLTLQISLKIGDILANEYENVAVKMSRNGDTFPSLSMRTNEANAWGAHFYLSPHINAFNGTANGFETFVYPGVKEPTLRYQSVIHDEIAKVIGMSNRGKQQKNLHVLRESNMPALLTESGFIDHPGDSAKMKDPAWIDAVARAHVTGLEKAFNLKKRVVVSSETTNKKVEPVTNKGPDYIGHEFEASIKKAIAKKIINGYDANTFKPNEPLTRGQLAVILDRLGLLN